MTTQTLTLTDFLLARIAEDERILIAPRRDQARHLTECEAKRRIVERCKWVDVFPQYANDPNLSAWWESNRSTLEDLALPYADHRDYREEWKP